MKRRFTISIIFILLFSLLPTSSNTYAQSTNKVVNAEILNLRSGPGLSYEVTHTLSKGEKLDVVSVSGDWLQVKYKNKTGWVASWLTSSSSSNNQVETNSKVVSQVDALNVRSSASIGSSIMGKMNAGDEATLLRNEGDWVLINLDGMIGWVHSDYVAQHTPQSTSGQTTQQQSADTFTVAVDALNVRKSDDLSSKKVNVVYKNETYPVNEIRGNWIRIVTNDQKEGWVYSFYGTLSSSKKQQASADSTYSQSISILTNGTNIRESASTSSNVVMLANAGEQFNVKQEVDDWYEVSLPSGQTAFVAKWVVSSTNEGNTLPTSTNTERANGTLKGLTIVIDAGHGGTDRGTTSANDVFEKNLTLKTSELLASKLKAAGATVHLTRETDTYIPLRKRVASSHQYAADAFISIHYDASLDTSISGFTTYYMHEQQKQLSSAINSGLDGTLSLHNRGSQPGNYYVLRENRQNAVLVELGFLSNPIEEHTINNDSFREQATHGIYNGLLDYFNSNAE